MGPGGHNSLRLRGFRAYGLRIYEACGAKVVARHSSFRAPRGRPACRCGVGGRGRGLADHPGDASRSALQTGLQLSAGDDGGTTGRLRSG
jgi:hypothetical protein